MSEFVETIQIFGMGILGILTIIFIKISEVNSENDNINFKKAITLFFQKATASYLSSVMVVFFYSVTHEEWIQWLHKDKSHSFVSQVIPLVLIIGYFVGAAMQYGVYKAALKKVDKIMKAWGGS